MRRTLATLAAAGSMLLVAPGVALAGDPVPVADPPAEFAPPVLAPVTDVPTAEAFAQRYVARNAPRFLSSDRRRVRVFDVQTRCLEHPVVADRFGCVFTLRAAVIQRSRGWDGHHGKAPEANAASKRGDDRRRHRRSRVRNYGCLGLLSVTGGPTVTPSAQVRLLECARVPRGDYEAPEPVQ